MPPALPLLCCIYTSKRQSGWMRCEPFDQLVSKSDQPVYIHTRVGRGLSGFALRFAQLVVTQRRKVLGGLVRAHRKSVW